MVIAELLSEVSKMLKGIENSAFEARQLLLDTLCISQTELILNRNKEISEKDAEKILNLAKKRLTGEPLQYILGSQEFMSLPFLVTKDTLIPRQDTETLVEFVLDEKEDIPLSVLDIGTGTGCIPISLAHSRQNFTCTGIDVSKNAIEIARKNAENLDLSERVTFEICDILSDIPRSQFDIVVSNPPYIKSSDIPNLQTEVRDFEPHIALDGGNDGLLFYRRICDISPKILKRGGLLAFEIGYDQRDDVFDIMTKQFKNIKTVKDLCGNNRVIAGCLE